jgi:fluoroacetyl-CoA thioesterase
LRYHWLAARAGFLARLTIARNRAAQRHHERQDVRYITTQSDKGSLLMKDIAIGTLGRFELIVASEHLANRFKDQMLPPVLATPVMIMVMENAALNALKPYLEPGETALGTRVDIAHLAATPLGRKVIGEARVTKVDGRHIAFEVRVHDAGEEIGRGTHERMLIDVAKFHARLASKFAPGTVRPAN